MRSTGFLLAAVVTAATVGSIASAQASNPLNTAPCAGISTTTTVFTPTAAPLANWAENLAFDGAGHVWVSRLNQNKVQEYDAAGHLLQTLSVNAPGGMILGLGGLIYVGTGDGFTDTGQAGIASFDPAAAHPVFTQIAKKLSGTNGLAQDADGNFYASNELNKGIQKIRPNGTIDVAWSNQAKVPSPDGITLMGDSIYVNRLLDPYSEIERIPLANPAAKSVVAKLSGSGLNLIPKGLDDLTPGPNGTLYTVAFALGQLLQVDPVTGKSCLLASGLHSPSSVHRPVNFGGFSATNDLFVTEASGRVVVVHLST